MKKSVVFLILLFAMFVGSSAFAQDKAYEVSVGGGILLPVSPELFRDQTKAVGFNVGGGVGYFVTEQMTIGGDVWYNRISEENGDHTFSATEVLGVAKYHAQSVYVLGGAGIAHLSNSASSNEAMVTVGAGMTFGSSTKFFVEGRFDVIFTEGDTTTMIPIRGGIVF